MGPLPDVTKGASAQQQADSRAVASLRVVTWNVNSFTEVKANYLVALSSVNPSVDVWCLQDVRVIGPDIKAVLNCGGLTMAMVSRDGSEAGGAAVVWRNSLNGKVWNPGLPPELLLVGEACAVEFGLLGECLRIVSVYIPPRNGMPPNSIFNLMQALSVGQEPLLVVGDLNARMALWCTKADSANGSTRLRGKELVRWMEGSTGMTLVPLGPTFLPAGTSPDVGFVRGLLVPPRVHSGVDTRLSDHALVKVDLGCYIVESDVPVAERHIARSVLALGAATEAHWKLYEERLRGVNWTLRGSVNSCATKLISSLRHASCVLPKGLVSSRRAGCSPAILKAVEMGDVVALRAAVIAARKKDVFAAVAQLSPKQPLPFFTAEEASHQFMPAKPAPPSYPAPVVDVEGMKRMSEGVTVALVGQAISNLSNLNSCDQFGIANAHLRRLPPAAVEFFVALLRRSLREGCPPKVWLYTMAGYTSKVEKASCIKEVRFFGLTSVFAKLAERCIYTLLLPSLILNPRQLAYKKGYHPVLSVVDTVAAALDYSKRPYVYRAVNNTRFSVKPVSIIVGLDYTEAFYSPFYGSILEGCTRIGVPSTLLPWLNAFLLNRVITFKGSNGVGAICVTPDRGTPPGVILAELLFRAVMDALLPELERLRVELLASRSVHFTFSLGADDLNFAFGGADALSVMNAIKVVVKFVVLWSSQKGLSLNAKKSHYMVVAQRATPDEYEAICKEGGWTELLAVPLNGGGVLKLPRREVTKIYGIMVKSTLVVDSTPFNTKVAGALSLLRCLRFKFPPDQLRRVWSAFGECHLRHLGPMSSRVLGAELEGFSRMSAQAARWVSGAMKSSPSADVHREAGVRSAKVLMEKSRMALAVAVIAAPSTLGGLGHFSVLPAVPSELSKVHLLSLVPQFIDWSVVQRVSFVFPPRGMNKSRSVEARRDYNEMLWALPADITMICDAAVRDSTMQAGGAWQIWCGSHPPSEGVIPLGRSCSFYAEAMVALAGLRELEKLLVRLPQGSLVAVYSDGLSFQQALAVGPGEDRIPIITEIWRTILRMVGLGHTLVFRFLFAHVDFAQHDYIDKRAEESINCPVDTAAPMWHKDALRLWERQLQKEVLGSSTFEKLAADIPKDERRFLCVPPSKKLPIKSQVELARLRIGVSSRLGGFEANPAAVPKDCPRCGSVAVLGRQGSGVIHMFTACQGPGVAAERSKQGIKGPASLWLDPEAALRFAWWWYDHGVPMGTIEEDEEVELHVA